MKKIVEFVYTFSFQTLKYISILFSFILFWGAFLYSSADTDITTLKTFIVKDNIFVSTLCILIFLGLMMLIKHICEKHPNKTKRVLLFITLGFYTLLGTFLILYVKSTPHTDSHFIYTIAKNFAKNNFSDIIAYIPSKSHKKVHGRSRALLILSYYHFQEKVTRPLM